MYKKFPSKLAVTDAMYCDKVDYIEYIITKKKYMQIIVQIINIQKNNCCQRVKIINN